MHHGPADYPDVMRTVMIDTDTLLDNKAAHGMPDNSVAHRRIEMFRAAQWLQQQVADSCGL
jgi:hypothetical protein